MATHSSVLPWRVPGTREPGGLPSMGSHRVGHDWSDLAAAAVSSSLCQWEMRKLRTQAFFSPKYTLSNIGHCAKPLWEPVEKEKPAAVYFLFVSQIILFTHWTLFVPNICDTDRFMGNGLSIFFLLVFLLLCFLLKDNFFTEFCCFLSNLNMNQWQQFLSSISTTVNPLSAWSTVD